MLVTVKVWPVDFGASLQVDPTANLDGACARRHRAAHAGKDNCAMRGIASLDEQ